jgi:hypothetical protein
MIQRPKKSLRNGDSGSPRPKKFKSQKSLSKVLAFAFWDNGGILLVDYLEKCANITAKHCFALPTN